MISKKNLNWLVEQNSDDIWIVEYWLGSPSFQSDTNRIELKSQSFTDAIVEAKILLNIDIET